MVLRRHENQQSTLRKSHAVGVSAIGAMAVGGVLLGLVLTWLASLGINYKFPLHRLVWDNSWVLRATLIAIVGALLGGLYPALRAAQKDPIEALAYE